MSSDDIFVARGIFYRPSLTWNTLCEDPIKAAILRAILSCQIRVNNGRFTSDMAMALIQCAETLKLVCPQFILTKIRGGALLRAFRGFQRFIGSSIP